MPEFQAGDHLYRTRPMCAADQWRLLNRLHPILPALQGIDFGLRASGAGVETVAAALAPLIRAKDDDMRAVFKACLAAVERCADGELWSAVAETPHLVVLMHIATEVIAENFAALFAMERPSFRPISSEAPKYTPVSMPDGEDWLFRPVLRGMCRGEGLYDGSLKIEQIAKFNDALDVFEENQARAQKAAEKKG